MLNLYTPANTFQKGRGPSTGSQFEQFSMQRLTVVPSPISGGTGSVGSGWAVIWKAPPYWDKAAPHNKIYLNFISKFVSTKFASSKNYTWTRDPRGARRMQPSIGKAGSLWGGGHLNRLNVGRLYPVPPTRSHGWVLSRTSNLIKTALQIQGLVTKPMRELIRQYLKNTRMIKM